MVFIRWLAGFSTLTNFRTDDRILSMKQTFTSGQVLTAAQMTSLQYNDYVWTVSTKTASYTLVADDAGTRIDVNSATATAITVNTNLFSPGQTLYIQNRGAGSCTITAGTATVSSSGSLVLGQYDGGTLYFVSTGVAIFFSATSTGDVTLTGTQTLTNKTLTAPISTYSINTQTGTTYTVVAADAGAFITMNNASASTLKIPTDANVNFAIGSVLTAYNLGAGVVTTSAVTSGTTTIVSAGATSAAPTLAQNKAISCTKIAANSWVALGGIA
jgi:hypothetical protein